MAIRFDVFIASLTLAAALVVSVVSYRRLQIVEKPSQELFQNLALGNHDYAVIEKGRCVGKLNWTMEVEPQISMVSTGEMHFSVRGKPSVAKEFLGAYFNVFNQMVACNVTIQTEKGKVNVRLSNPSPISVQILYTVGGKENEQRLEIPGPILLKENSDGSYRLDYSALSGSLSPYSSSFSSYSSLHHFDFTLQPLQASASLCANLDSHEASVDLDPLIEQARSFLAQMRQLPFLFSIPGDI